MHRITALVFKLLAVAAVAFAHAAADVHSGVHTIPLNGTNWSVANQNGSIAVPAAVPGDIYGDLMRAEIIGEPFYRFNDLNYRWIAYENWTYKTHFSFDNAAQAAGTVVLVFEGLQVAADVLVNGQLVGRAHDQFQQYEFPVNTSLLQVANNTLEVRFTSSVAYATRRYNEYPVKPKPDAPDYLEGLPHRNFVRAEQSSFGWDWGPAFAPVGIYRNACIRVFRPYSLPSSQQPHASSPLHSIIGASASSGKQPPYHIQYVTPHIFSLPFGQPVLQPLSDDNNSFLVDVYVYATCAASSDCFRDGSIIVAEVEAQPGQHQQPPQPPIARNITRAWTLERDSAPCRDAVGSLCTAFARIQLTVHNARLWWPHGSDPAMRNKTTSSGADPKKPWVSLCHLNVHVRSSTQVVVAADARRIGFRSVELVTRGDPLDYGLPTPNPPKDVMFFRVNGVPVFAKGANVVPFDAFQSRVTKAGVEHILESAVAANMNMVRVWGGGIFPLQSFYDMCDEKGLMVWQEMIFACAQYPVDPAFLQDVRLEIRHQLRRLGAHASIAMWSGNNENGIYDKGPGSPYEQLDYGTVLDEVIRQDTSRPIWPSSPSRGFASGITASGLPAGTMEHPAPFVVGGSSGDSHFYSYFSCPNISISPRSNFASEFGFQSLPWLSNFAPVSEAEDWGLFSPLMQHRQHHPDGNEEIANLIAQNFGIPPSAWNFTNPALFRRAIFLSQLQQTLCISDEAAFYRRGRDEPYRTSGSLYWQLNQNWQAPSWTSIEYGGEWKVLHYAMKAVYSRVFVSAFVNSSDDSATAHIASDLLQAVMCHEGLSVSLVPFNTTKFVRSEYQIVQVTDIELQPLRGTVAWRTPNLSALLAAHKSRCPQRSDCFLFFELMCSAALGADAPLSPTPLWLSDIKDIPMPQPRVDVGVVNVTDKAVKMRVSSTGGVALYVFLQAWSPLSVQGTFNKNGFVVLPGKDVEVEFSCLAYEGNPCDVRTITPAAWTMGLEVYTLNGALPH